MDTGKAVVVVVDAGEVTTVVKTSNSEDHTPRNTLKTPTEVINIASNDTNHRTNSEKLPDLPEKW